MENLLHQLISIPQHPRQWGISITTFHTTPQSPQMFKWLFRKWPPFNKYLLSWENTTRGSACRAHGPLTSLDLDRQEASGGGSCYLHFTQGETEAQKDEITCLKAGTFLVAELGLSQDLPNSKTKKAWKPPPRYQTKRRGEKYKEIPPASILSSQRTVIVVKIVCCEFN